MKGARRIARGISEATGALVVGAVVGAHLFAGALLLGAVAAVGELRDAVRSSGGAS